ncbi:MAG: hypothetical protein IKE75_02550 [Bacilli bacterium]|nr:hypothetical protein [Bacilli bacterium]
MEEKKRNLDGVNTIGEIDVAFARLIGPLATMGALNIFKDDHEEIKKLLDIVVNWSAEFQLKRTLSFISREELLDIYERIEKLKDKYVYDVSLGDDNELSDDVSIWMWEIMLLRKKQIEGDER